MKYFVFSDVHGCINELKTALTESGYDANNKDHMLLFLGDAFGHNATGHYETYRFLKEKIENNKLKWIYGNHEIYLLNALQKEEPSKFTIETVRDIAIGLDPKAMDYTDKECILTLKKSGIDAFIKNNCINYFETEDYVFTHGFIPYKKSKNEFDPSWRDVKPENWNYFRCLNGMKIVHKGLRIPNKTLVCGHVGAYYGYIIKNYPDLQVESTEFNKLAKKLMKDSKTNKEPFSIYYGDGVIGIDTRAYDTKRVNVFVLTQ